MSLPSRNLWQWAFNGRMLLRNHYFSFRSEFFFLSERAGTVAINLAVPAAVPAAVPGGSSDGPSRRGGSISSTAIGVDSNPTHWMMDRTYVDPLSLFFLLRKENRNRDKKKAFQSFAAHLSFLGLKANWKRKGFLFWSNRFNTPEWISSNPVTKIFNRFDCNAIGCYENLPQILAVALMPFALDRAKNEWRSFR